VYIVWTFVLVSSKSTMLVDESAEGVAAGVDVLHDERRAGLVIDRDVAQAAVDLDLTESVGADELPPDPDDRGAARRAHLVDRDLARARVVARGDQRVARIDRVDGQIDDRI